ncbi:MAG: hypothetical protein MJE77_36120 [Proteobacteria bacterium]|nr:hypothetical protein [Pseudomonadota bacterium]
MSIVLTWNGVEIPKELRNLPKGRYVLEPVDTAIELTQEQEEGLRDAMASVRAGDGIPAERARAQLEALLGK